MTRLVSLTLLPAHYDELLQLQRIDLMVNEGKVLEGFDEIFLFKWLQVLLIAPLLGLPGNPLWLGRFVTVLAGLLGGLGCYVLAVELYRRPAVGIVASLLYFVSPFVLLYDRLIMPDGLLTGLGVWLMIFSGRVVRRQQPRWAVAAGITIAAAGLAKESGFIYMVIPLSALLVLEPDRIWSKQTWRLFSVIYGLALLVLAFMAIILVLKPEIFWVYLNKTGGEKIFSWQLWLNNSRTALSWLANLMTVPLLALGAAGGALALLRRDRPGIFLLTIPVVLPLVYILVSKAWFPRYLLPVTPPLSILGAWLLILLYDRLGRFRLPAAWRLSLLVSLGLILAGRALLTDFWLLVDPPQAPLHPRERWQYIEDWPTAYGLAEAAAYIESIAADYDALYLAVNQNSTVVLKGLDIYFDRPANVEIVTFDAYAGQTIDRLNKWSLDRPTFLILNTAREKGMNEIWQNPKLFFQGVKRAGFDKPGRKASIDVYQWRSVPDTVAHWAARRGVEPAIILSPQYNPAETQPGPPTEAQLREANFVLVDMSTGLFNSTAQLNNIEEWLGLLPPDWALTLYYPGQWYLFRLENNAPPQYPAQTTLNEVISLTGFDLPRPDYRPGETVPITLHWQAVEPAPGNYRVFVQLVGADGTLYAQQDLEPLWPTGQWRVGQRLADGHDLLLDEAMPPGTYHLLIGLIDPATGRRLPAYQENGNRWPADAVVLINIVVVQP
ncbi:MAG: glycosyltransferase family 39 protein [Chloroflexota bacterium]